MALRATESDEDQLEGGQSWPQPPFRRLALPFTRNLLLDK